MADRPVTLLFTDLANCAELLRRTGDESAQRALRAHRALLRTAAAAHGGSAEQWFDGGFLLRFPSSADAVRCAVTMQQTARRRAAGERLAVRIALHAGELSPDEIDVLAPPIQLVRRLCERAGSGEILCSAVVAELLDGRRAFQFGAATALRLDGYGAPIFTHRVLYDRDDLSAMLRHLPFAGRTA